MREACLEREWTRCAVSGFKRPNDIRRNIVLPRRTQTDHLEEARRWQLRGSAVPPMTSVADTESKDRVSRTEFETGHLTHVHNLSHNFEGDRIATCSSDLRIRIWDHTPGAGWRLSAELPRVHTGSIQKVAWAHSGDGALLASASVDGIIFIYKETRETGTGRRSWKQMARLVDSRGSVEDLAFAPGEGSELLLASCSKGSREGVVRVYGASGDTQVSTWSPVGEYKFTRSAARCLSWNPSRFDPPMLVLGGDSRAHVCRQRASGDEQDSNGVWEGVCDLKGHKGGVLDVAWAPNVGRLEHFIATACEDHVVRVFSLVFGPDEKLTADMLLRPPPPAGEGKATAKAIFQMSAHGCPVWSLAWDPTGNSVASTGERGHLHVSARARGGVWSLRDSIALPGATSTATVSTASPKEGSNGGGLAGTAALSSLDEKGTSSNDEHDQKVRGTGQTGGVGGGSGMPPTKVNAKAASLLGISRSNAATLKLSRRYVPAASDADDADASGEPTTGPERSGDGRYGGDVSGGGGFSST